MKSLDLKFFNVFWHIISADTTFMRSSRGCWVRGSRFRAFVQIEYFFNRSSTSSWRRTWFNNVPRSYWMLSRTIDQLKGRFRLDCSRWTSCSPHRYVTGPLQTRLLEMNLMFAPQVCYRAASDWTARDEPHVRPTGMLPGRFRLDCLISGYMNLWTLLKCRSK